MQSPSFYTISSTDISSRYCCHFISLWPTSLIDFLIVSSSQTYQLAARRRYLAKVGWARIGLRQKQNTLAKNFFHSNSPHIPHSPPPQQVLLTSSLQLLWELPLLRIFCQETCPTRWPATTDTMLERTSGTIRTWGESLQLEQVGQKEHSWLLLGWGWPWPPWPS